MESAERNGVELSYRVVGDGDRDLLLVHGWMVSGTVFDELIEALDGERWRLIVPDLRGAGASGESESYRLQDYAGDLEAIVDAAGASSVSIVGHSMGGQIAQLFAATYPERVERMVLLSPVPASGIELPEEVDKLFRQSGADRTRKAQILDMACLDLPDAAAGRLLDAAEAISPDCIRQSYRAWTTGGFRQSLSQITAPTLVVASDDPFLPAELLETAVVEPIADARLVHIGGAGHYIPVERPGQTADVVEDFLDDPSHISPAVGGG